MDSRPKATECKGGHNGWVIQCAFTRSWQSYSSASRGTTRAAASAGRLGWVVMAKLPDASIRAAKFWADVAVWWRQRIMAQDFQRQTILMTRRSMLAQSNAMALLTCSARALMLWGCKPRLVPIAEQEVQSAAVNKDGVTWVGMPPQRRCRWVCQPER